MRPYVSKFNAENLLKKICSDKCFKSSKLLMNALKDKDKGYFYKILQHCVKYEDNDLKYDSKTVKSFINIYKMNKIHALPDLIDMFKYKSFSNDNIDFINRYIDDKNLPDYLRIMHKPNDEDVLNINKLIHEGFSKKDIEYCVSYSGNGTDFSLTGPITEKIIFLKNKNIPPRYIGGFIANNIDNDGIEGIVSLRNKLIERIEYMQTFDDDVTVDDIDETLFRSITSTVRVIEVLGTKVLLNNYNLYEIDKNISTIGNIDSNHESYQSLIEITNPMCSKKYKQNLAKIKELKKLYVQGANPELISQINTLTKKNNDMVKNAIVEPQDKIDTARIFFGVLQLKACKINNLLRYLNPKNQKEKLELNNRLNKIIINSFYPKQDSNKTSRLNLKNSKYLKKMFFASESFQTNFKKMLSILSKDSWQPAERVFNNLPQNQETQKVFEKYGINYDAYVRFSPQSFIEFQTNLDVEKLKSNVLKNFYSDFNSKSFELIPDEKKEKIFDALKMEGFKIDKETRNLRFSFNNKPIGFSELSKILRIIYKTTNEDDFWIDPDLSTVEGRAANTIIEHLLGLRKSEMQNAARLKANRSVNIKIQKANMNDIGHSLFLGNDASCCTAVGSGCNDWTAPNYIMNKLFSCIEVIDGEKPIGNTMCYIAEIANKPALILDNIELKPEYQYNDDIRDGIFNYAKKFAAEIGCPDMPIFAGPNLHKVNMDEFPFEEKVFKILGSTGNDKVYLDFDVDEHIITGKEIFTDMLYRVK